MQLPTQGLAQALVSTPPWITPPYPPLVQSTGVRDYADEILSPSHWSLSNTKRTFDTLVAAMALILLALPMLVIAICVRISSRGPALFMQSRVGHGGRLFSIYKFRSMRLDSAAGPGITCSGDQRITALGLWLRRFKLDELPQFYNVLRGQMSLVGPRPKLPLYESNSQMPYRPGLTGAATLAFRREEEILSAVHSSQLDIFYAKEIKPVKARIDMHYMGHATFLSDLRLITATAFSCLMPASIPAISLESAAAQENRSIPA